MEAQAGRSREGESEARGKLLAAAADLFARKGYAATTVREIVSAAGVTPPVLYYYFESKEGLFLELMKEPFERFSAGLGQAQEGTGTARSRLERLCQDSYRLFCENLDAARVMYSIYYGPPQGAPFVDLDALHERFRETVRDLVQQGIGAGEFAAADPEGMMWAVIGALNVATELELCHPDRSLGAPGLAGVLEVVFRGMAAGVSGEGERR